MHTIVSPLYQRMYDKNNHQGERLYPSQECHHSLQKIFGNLYLQEQQEKHPADVNHSEVSHS